MTASGRYQKMEGHLDGQLSLSLTLSNPKRLDCWVPLVPNNLGLSLLLFPAISPHTVIRFL